MRSKIIFLIAIIGAVTWLQFSTANLIGNDDVYWHIRYSEQLLHNLDDARSFLLQPIPYTGFLFHAVLALFALIFPLVLASKLAGILLASTVFFLIALVMQSLKVKGTWFWVALLFIGSVNFTFRLLLTRTFLMSLIFLLLGIYFLIRKNKWGLGISGALYGLSYVAAPMLIAVAAVWAMIQWVSSKKRDFNFIYVSIIGVTLGFILNPAFPDSLGHVIRYVLPVFTHLPLANLDVGTELYRYSLWDFLRYEFLIVAIWLPSVFWSGFLVYKKRLTLEQLFVQIIALGFFALALFARRFIEYWAPFAIIASAVSYSNVLNEITFKNVKTLLLNEVYFRFALSVAIAVIILSAWLNLTTIHFWAQPSRDIAQYEVGATWLKQNAQPDEIVFNTHWSDYPKLYYWNPVNNYFIKFDPSALYIDDDELYWNWRKISNDDVAQMSIEEIYTIVKIHASSSYIFLNANSSQLRNKLESGQEYFQEVYADDNYLVFQVKKTVK